MTIAGLMALLVVMSPAGFFGSTGGELCKPDERFDLSYKVQHTVEARCYFRDQFGLWQLLFWRGEVDRCYLGRCE